MRRKVRDMNPSELSEMIEEINIARKQAERAQARETSPGVEFGISLFQELFNRDIERSFYLEERNLATIEA